MSFYGKGPGNKLIIESNYPNEIKNFLKEEERILTEVMKDFSVLIEVGCMYGRYMHYSILNHFDYFGVDPSMEYISEGNAQKNGLSIATKCEFIHGSSYDLDKLLEWERLEVNPRSSLLFFPFNSFGNMPDYGAVIRSLRKTGASFLISTYSTSLIANHSRRDYYQACSFDLLEMKENYEGVRFQSKEGLNSIAYHQDFITDIFKSETIQVRVIPFAELGLVYTSIL